jgi:hypothetical protein
MRKNFYQVLGVANSATTAEIAEAHRKMHQRIASSGLEDADTTALLQDALETLSDPAARASYDQTLTAPEPVVRLGAPIDAPLMMEHAEEDSGDRRTLIRIATILVTALLTILVGYFLFGRSSPPPPELAVTSNEAPRDNAPPASAAPEPAQPAGTQNSPSPKPRTADQIFAEVSNSVVRVNVMDNSGNVIAGGSGVVIARSTVITNCHVALRGPQVGIRAAKQDFPASIDIADETFDLCQLSVGGGFSAPSVEVGNVKYVRPGQKVFAIGSPQGLDLTISEGIVSSLRETKLGTLIQTTAPISQGSSGGGLFNVSGQLIGITTFQSKTGQNLNFAVPADWIAEMQTREGPGPSLQ